MLIYDSGNNTTESLTILPPLYHKGYSGGSLHCYETSVRHKIFADDTKSNAKRAFIDFYLSITSRLLLALSIFNKGLLLPLFQENISCSRSASPIDV